MGKVSKGCMKLTNASLVTYSSMVLISVIISILQIFDHKNPSIILTRLMIKFADKSIEKARNLFGNALDS